MQAPKIPAQIRDQDSDYLVAVWHETLIVAFRGVCSLQHVLNISKACRALLAERRGQVTYLTVIERSSPAPTETVRAELAIWSRDLVSQMAMAAAVAEGGGFKNALVRGVGVALTVLAPHKVPFKFTGSVDEAAALLAPYLPKDAGGAPELSLAVAEVRQRWEGSL